MPIYIRHFVGLFAFLMFVFETSAPVKAQPIIDQARNLFGKGQYNQIPNLLAPPYNGPPVTVRTSVMPYWIGASYCRTGKFATGLKWLSHTEDRWRLAKRDRRILRSEQRSCRVHPSSQPPSITFSEEVYNRSAELLYTGTNPLIAARPFHAVLNVSEDELASRLTPLNNMEIANPKAAQLIEKIEAARGNAQICDAPSSALRARFYGRYGFISRTNLTFFDIRGYAAAMEAFAQRLRGEFGIGLPPHYITVYVAGCAKEAKLIARTLHGLDIDSDQISGYSIVADMSAVAIRDAEGMDMRTVIHELFHLIVKREFPNIPAWLEEGLAQYFGVQVTSPSQTRESRFPDTWSELPSLRDVLEAGWPGFDAVQKADQLATNGEAGCLPIATMMMHADVARMFLAYVDKEPRRLAKLFDATMKATPNENEASTDVDVVEKVMNLPIDELDKAYQAQSVIEYRPQGLFDNIQGQECSEAS